VVTRQLQVERRTGKVRRSKTDVLPLCHATNHTGNVECFRTDALEPGLGSFPGGSERLVLRSSATHADFDGGRDERAVAEASRRVIAGGTGRRGVGRRRGQFTGAGRLVASSTHVRDADEPDRRRTLRLLDEVHASVNGL